MITDPTGAKEIYHYDVQERLCRITDRNTVQKQSIPIIYTITLWSAGQGKQIRQNLQTATSVGVSGKIDDKFIKQMEKLQKKLGKNYNAAKGCIPIENIAAPELNKTKTITTKKGDVLNIRQHMQLIVIQVQ